MDLEQARVLVGMRLEVSVAEDLAARGAKMEPRDRAAMVGAYSRTGLARGQGAPGQLLGEWHQRPFVARGEAMPERSWNECPLPSRARPSA